MLPVIAYCLCRFVKAVSAINKFSFYIPVLFLHSVWWKHQGQVSEKQENTNALLHGSVSLMMNS